MFVAKERNTKRHPCSDGAEREESLKILARTKEIQESADQLKDKCVNKRRKRKRMTKTRKSS
jgi:hypothetical protein